ncbi:MAG: O-antigen ligase family protein [Planctomycetota bacterium]
MKRSASRWVLGLAALALLTPLVVGHAFFAEASASLFVYPFVASKVFYFRTVAILLAAGLIPLLVSRRARLRLSPINVAVTLFLLSYVFSALVGADVRRSFLDTPSRMLSLFTILCFVTFYLVLASSLRSWGSWRFLLRVLLVVGVLVFVVAVLEKFRWVSGIPERPASTLGNPIFLAAFASFTAFMAFLVAARESAPFWRWFAVATAVFALVAIFLSESRGTLLGVLAGAAVMLLAYRADLTDRVRLRRVVDAVLVAGVAMVALAWFGRDTEIAKKLPLVRRLAGVRIEAGTARVRVYAWGVALRTGKERPWRGCGPNNFYHAYNHFYQPKMLIDSGGESYADHAHNVPAHTLAAQGLPGLLSYLFLMVAPLFVLIRKYERKKIDAHVAAAGMGFVAAHFVHGLFAFDEVNSYLCLFMLLALVDGLDESGEAADEREPRRAPRWLTALCGAVALAGIVVGNVIPARANWATYRAVKAVLQRSENATALVEKAGRCPSPHRVDHRAQIAEVLVTYPDETLVKNEQAGDLLEEAWQGIEEALSRSPLNVRLTVIGATIVELQAALVDRTDHAERAVEMLEEALWYAPMRQDLKFSMARMYFALGDPEEAFDWAEEAYEDEPDAPESVWQFGLVLERLGFKDEARELVRAARARGVVFTGKSARFAAGIERE